MGFRIRFAAQLLNAVLLAIAGFIITLSPILSIFSMAIILYMLYKTIKGETHGRKLLGMKVVKQTREEIGFGTGLLRAAAKLVSASVLYLGFIWIAFDSQKQGWHDKIANTYVVRK